MDNNITKQDELMKETVSLLDREGIADLMTTMTEKGYKDSVQLGANLMLLGLIQYRVFGVAEDEIIKAVKIQVPLADMVIEIVGGSSD
jgi:hypothetical protein